MDAVFRAEIRKKIRKNKNSVYWMIENVEKSRKQKEAKKTRKIKNKKNRKKIEKESERLEAVRLRSAPEGALMKSYRKPGRSSREEGYWLTEGCVACTKKCMERDCRQAEGDIGRKFYKLISCRLV